LKYLISVSIFLFIFQGCFSKKKIVIGGFTAPKEQSKVEGMIGSGEVSKDGKYLLLAINPEINFGKFQNAKSLEPLLVAETKSAITETNFISLHPIYDVSKIALNMSIVSFTTTSSETSRKVELGVSFNITKGVSEYYTKVYSVKEKRFSKSAQTLPTLESIFEKVAKKVVKKFIKDISPMKTSQLREVKDFPSEISHLESYLDSGNYEAVVSGMEQFQKRSGEEQDLDFYYNLAIFYEALASQKEDFSLLEKAKINYDKALSLDNSDEVLLETKSKFDKFYNLVKSINRQNSANSQKERELEEDFGVTF
jgi:tetratricopeptide (TPR) repeat protein